MQEEQLLNPKHFNSGGKKKKKSITYPIQKMEKLQRNLGTLQLDLKLTCSLLTSGRFGSTYFATHAKAPCVSA